MQRILTVLALTFCLAWPARAQFWGAPSAPAPMPQAPGVPQFRPKHPAQPKLPGPAKPPGQAATEPAKPAGPPQPAATETPAPYDHDLQRLSEILGALHFLRGLCNSNEGLKWRNEAQSLIDAEVPTGGRHDEMVASFNRGYRGFQQSYRTCTPAAEVIIRRYLEEGARLARDITARYAN